MFKEINKPKKGCFVLDPFTNIYRKASSLKPVKGLRYFTKLPFGEILKLKSIKEGSMVRFDGSVYTLEYIDIEEEELIMYNTENDEEIIASSDDIIRLEVLKKISKEDYIKQQANCGFKVGDIVEFIKRPIDNTLDYWWSEENYASVNDIDTILTIRPESIRLERNGLTAFSFIKKIGNQNDFLKDWQNSKVSFKAGDTVRLIRKPLRYENNFICRDTYKFHSSKIPLKLIVHSFESGTAVVSRIKKDGYYYIPYFLLEKVK